MMMLTNTQEGQQLINKVAYAIISEHAPVETVFYVQIRDRYLAKPENFFHESLAEDAPLGFGDSATIGMFSVVVFPIVTPLLKLLVEEAIKALGKNAGSEAIAWVGSLFSKEKQKKPSLFTAQELARIKKEFDQISKKEAERLQLSEDAVQAVRDAVLARLAISMA